MKRLSLFIVLIIITLYSCRKEEITDINIIDIKDPTLIDGVFFKGITTDGENKVDDALVEIFQNETLIGTVKSDAGGNFNTAGLQLEPDKHVTFNVKKEGYVEYAQRINSPKAGVNETSIRILKKEDALYQPLALANPGSNDLINISGLVTNNSGSPISDVFVVIFSECFFIGSNQLELIGGIALTDINGNYSLLLPKNQALYYLVSESGCGAGILTGQDRLVCDFIPVKDIGPFNINVILPVINNALGQTREFVSFQVSGSFNNCMNIPVFWGTADVTMQIGTNISNRKYSVFNGTLIGDEVNWCLTPEEMQLPLIVKVKAKDNQTNKISEELTFEFPNRNPNLGTITICNDIPPPIIISQMNISIGTKQYSIVISLPPDHAPNAQIRNDSLLVPIIPSNSNGNISFAVPEFSSNIFNVKNFKYDGAEFSYRQENFNLKITPLPGQNTFGDFISGTVRNITNGSEENVQGFIQILYQ
ncbi:MAG: hypothetical protein IPM42_02705 [Saprospiraceae bacterium]|nr:hypothetical protein [Saprospiraceae bacterium]